MASIRLTPSSYYLSSSSYLSVSSAANMYDDTESTSYATVTNSRSSTTSYYIYLRGFNFDDIPEGAIINSFTVKLKARESGVSTSTSYKPYLANGTTTINGSCDVITTTAAVHTFTGLSADWEDIKGYGADFGIRINCRRASRNTTSYMYIYGAEILVDYTIPVHHTVTISNSTTVAVTASDTNPLEGENVEIKASTLSGISVTDNGTDVTSRFVQRSETAESYTVENVGTYGFNYNSSTGFYTSNNKGVDKSAAVCRLDFCVPVEATITFTYINYAEQNYDFGVFGNIDVALSNNYYAAGSSGAKITDSSYKYACSMSSPSQQTLTYTMAAGTHSIWVKFSKDDGSASGDDTLQFKVSITLNEPFAPGTYYGYDIVNITTNHTIIVSYNASVPPVITIGIPDKSRISDETGCRECLCTFTADQALTQWEARAVKNGVTPARGVGLLVESGTNLPAGTSATVSVIDTELTDGDGVYLIAVYGCNAGGAWNE